MYIRNEDGGSSGTGLLDGLFDARKDGLAEVSLSGLLGVCATDNIGSYAGINTVSFRLLIREQYRSRLLVGHGS